MANQNTIFPLEKILKSSAEDQDLHQTFPDHTRAYYKDYENTLECLRRTIYPEINVGLAVHSNHGEVGIYTDHGPEHFDEVVRYAGVLLGLDVADVGAADRAFTSIKLGDPWVLSPYEIYLLLHAIRFHDAGNIYGRKNHEKKILNVMKDIGNCGLEDRLEREIIKKIAQAHGGKVSLNDKDTIGKLQVEESHNKVKYRPQLLAAIVRLADELCEGRRRSSNIKNLPKGNEIYHKYAASIEKCELHNGNLDIKFGVEQSEAITTFGKDNDVTFITDEIMSRLDKMELERRYCNMFLLPNLQVRKFVATISIWRDEECEDEGLSHKVIIMKEIEVSESGYPGNASMLCNRLPDLTGENLRIQLSDTNGG